MNSKKTTPEFRIHYQLAHDNYKFHILNRENVTVAMFDNESDAEIFCLSNNTEV